MCLRSYVDHNLDHTLRMTSEGPYNEDMRERTHERDGRETLVKLCRKESCQQQVAGGMVVTLDREQEQHLM